MPNSVEQANDFLMRTGICITRWAKFEEHLFNIFRLSLGARLDHAAIVYYRTPTLDARINLVDEIIGKPERKNGGHPHPDLKEWNEVRKAVGELLAIRRRIAHHPVRGNSKIEEKGELLVETTWIEIAMSANEALRGKSNALRGKRHDPLKVDDLVQHCAAVQEVTTRVARFERGMLPNYVG